MESRAGLSESFHSDRSMLDVVASRRQFLIATAGGAAAISLPMTAVAGEVRSGTAGRVWVIGPDGKPAAITVTLGLSDGASTEVLRGEVREGQDVIVGSAGGTGRGAQPQQGAPRLRL